MRAAPSLEDHEREERVCVVFASGDMILDQLRDFVRLKEATGTDSGR